MLRLAYAIVDVLTIALQQREGITFDRGANILDKNTFVGLVVTDKLD